MEITPPPLLNEILRISWRPGGRPGARRGPWRRRRRPESLIKPAVHEGFQIWEITVPGLLIKPIVYEGFRTGKSAVPGLLIKPVVYQGFCIWKIAVPGLLITVCTSGADGAGGCVLGG